MTDEAASRPDPPVPRRVSYLFASSLVAIVPVVILFIVIEKWLVGGLTAGSIK